MLLLKVFKTICTFARLTFFLNVITHTFKIALVLFFKLLIKLLTVFELFLVELLEHICNIISEVNETIAPAFPKFF